MEEDKGLETQKIQPPAPVTKPPRGIERPIDQEDLIFPRAKLLQPGSPEVTSQLPGQPPTNWAGQLIDSLTKTVLPMEFIPVFYTKNWIRFNATAKDDPSFDPNFGPSELIWRSDDPLDLRVQRESKFADDGTPPLATTFMNFFAMFPGHGMPVIVSFSRSSYKAGKTLLNLILRTKADAFATKYRIVIKKNDGPNNSVYYSMDVEPVGPANAAEFSECEKLWELYHAKAKTLKVDEEHPDDTDAAAQEAGSQAGGEKRPF